MKIRYLALEEHIKSRALYEEVFVEDEKTFVDAYYKIKAAGNKILVAEDGTEPVSMLHRNPYTFSFRGTRVRADYIVAVATRYSYRHQGWMRRLLTRALQDMAEEEMPFTFLMPADEAIYTPFDFRLMGNVDEESLSGLSSEELSADYDLYVEKDEEYERRHIFWPEWETTPMMVRLVDAAAFVRQIGAEEDQSLVISLTDPILPGNNGTFLWKLVQEGSSLTPSEGAAELEISIADLGSFLCGMLGAEELPGIEKAANPEALTKKLNRIRVLDGIYINETV